MIQATEATAGPVQSADDCGRLLQGPLSNGVNPSLISTQAEVREEATVNCAGIWGCSAQGGKSWEGARELSVPWAVQRGK